MGISKTTAFLLQELSSKGLLHGDLLQLGVQRISPDAKHLVNSFSALELSKRKSQATSSKAQFWHTLGFENVSSLDNSDFEGAEIVWDLNLPINDSLVDLFDVVFDGGTMEHVFNTSCVLENTNSLLREGGLAIHEVPSSNFIDHGFYSFSPNLFREYYLNKGYEIIEILLIVKKRYKAKVYQYFPRDAGAEIPENWGDRNVNVWCVARKGSNIVRSNVPQQKKYADSWSQNDDAQIKVSDSSSNLKIFRRKIRSSIYVMRKKSSIFVLLTDFFYSMSKKKITMFLKYEIRSKKNGDFV